MSQPFMFQMADDMREALDDYCGEHNKSLAAVVREAVAVYIDFEEGAGLRTKRRRKYASEEEQREAQNKRNALRRAGEREILRMFKNGASIAELQKRAQELDIDLTKI